MTTNPLINFDNEEPENKLPVDLEDFMAVNGISDDKYKVIVKRAPLEGGQLQEMPGGWTSRYPEKDDLGKWWGPGKYYLIFSYRAMTDEGKGKLTHKQFEIILGEEYMPMHKDYLHKRRLENEKNAMERNREHAVDVTSIMGPGMNSDPLKQLQQSVRVARELSMSLGGSPYPVAQGADKELLPLLIQSMQTSQQQTMQMFMEMSKNTMLMLTTMMKSNSNVSPMDNLKELSQMFTQFRNLNESITPEKKTGLDKVLEMFAPFVSTIVAGGLKGAQMAKMAKQSQTFKEIEGDAVSLKYMIERLDETQGPEITNSFLKVMGLKRPGAPESTEVQQETEAAEAPQETEAGEGMNAAGVPEDDDDDDKDLDY